MSKIYKGTINFGGLFQPTAGQPLDDRLIVQSYADLLTPNTFKVDGSATGDRTWYVGMIVSVVDEAALYLLIGADPTVDTNWKKIGSDVDISGHMIDVVYDDAKAGFFNDTDDPDHEHKITDTTVDEEGKYLMLILAEDETPVYIKSSDLVDLKDYYKKDEVDSLITALDSSVDSRIDLIDADLIEKQESIDDINDAIATIDNSIADIETEQSVQRAAIEALEDFLDSSIGDHLSELDSSVDILEGRVDALDGDILTITATIDEIGEAIEGINAVDASLDAAIKTLNDAIDAFLEEVEERLSDIDSSLEEIDSKLEDLKQEVEEEMEAKLADVDASIIALKEKDIEIEDAIEELQGDLREFMDSSLVKTIKAESLSDYVVLTPTTATTGDVTISADLVVVSMADASTNNKGLAEASDVKSYIAQQIASSEHLKFKVVDLLPEKSKADLHTIYLVPKADSTRETDVYQEYMLIDGKWELLGDTTINLENYYTKAEIDAKVDDIEESIATIVEIDEAQDEHLEELDSSISILDSSVNALEEKLKSGVVSSITSQSNDTTDSIRLTTNVKAKGDVEITLDASVVDHYDESADNKGLVTANYVEERISWIEIEED